MNRAIFGLISVAVLAGGIGVNKYLVATKPKTKKSDKSNQGVPVEVSTVERISTMIHVRARGTVMPARKVVLGTEVGGKVIKISPELQPGGKFKKGEIIARIDPTDYRIAVEQSFAAVDSAQAQLSIEKGLGVVAKQNLEMFGNEEVANKQLALREPQMRSATTQLKAARSGLKRARLGVERTLLRAPFDGMVQNRNVELGQIVSPGAPLLNFVGTQSYWVQVSVPVERLAWISIPGVSGLSQGSKVKIHHRVGKEHIEKDGTILRLLSEVDPAGRMARLIIEVKDPMGLAQVVAGPALVAAETPMVASSRLPLLLGTYVDVEIEGRKADNIIELSRSALRDGDMVYIMTKKFTLEKRKVEVLWRREDVVLVSSGLEPGESIIVSPLSAAIDGMLLRIPLAEKTSVTPPKTPTAAATLEPAASPEKASSDGQKGESL